MPAPKKQHRQKRPSRIPYDSHPYQKRPIHIGLVECMWATSALLAILGTVLVMSSSHILKVAGVWVFVGALVIGAIGVGVRLSHEILQSSDGPKPSELDKSPLPTLTKPNGSPALVIPPSIPSSSPSPAASDSVTLLEIERRLGEAKKHGKKEQVLKSLDGTKVDCVMHFFVAKRRRNMILVGFKEDREGPISILSVELPAEGNEHWLTTGTLDVYRIRGEIDAKACDPITIGVRNATLEYVRTDQASLSVPPKPTTQVEATPKNIPLDSATADFTPKQIRDRILTAPRSRCCPGGVRWTLGGLDAAIRTGQVGT